MRELLLNKLQDYQEEVKELQAKIDKVAVKIEVLEDLLNEFKEDADAVEVLENNLI